MAVTVLAGGLRGVDAIAIRVEVDLLRRLPATCIVGLPASAVRESSERIRSAIEALADEPGPRQPRLDDRQAPGVVRRQRSAGDQLLRQIERVSHGAVR